MAPAALDTPAPLSQDQAVATAITSYGRIPGAVFNGVNHVSLARHYDQLDDEYPDLVSAVWRRRSDLRWPQR